MSALWSSKKLSNQCKIPTLNENKKNPVSKIEGKGFEIYKLVEWMLQMNFKQGYILIL